MIKAIETIYNGYRFRSRLEARWAVFFDAAGIRYEYEREGYDLGDGGWYLPDFVLPDIHITKLPGMDSPEVFIEIKPPAEGWPKHKAWDSVDAKGDPSYLALSLVMLCGSPWLDAANQPCYEGYVFGDNYRMFCRCNECGTIGIEFSGYADRLCKCYRGGRRYGHDDPVLLNAYRAAKQARFEHGENGYRKGILTHG